MKHLQKLSMAFLAILMGMNFAACSDDDNNEGGQGGNALGTSMTSWTCTMAVTDGCPHRTAALAVRTTLCTAMKATAANTPSSHPTGATDTPSANTPSTTCCAVWTASRANMMLKDT